MICYMTGWRTNWMRLIDYTRAKIWVQATPDYACVFSLSQGSGAPDPTR